MSWSSRNTPAAFGVPAITRTAMSPGQWMRVRRRQVIRGQGIAAARPPDLRERLFELGNGRTADLDARIAPGFETALGIAAPLGADAHAGDEADAAVDRDRLAMIARQPAQRAVEPEGIEPAHLRAGVAQVLPEAAGSARPQAIVDDADANCRRAPLRQAPPQTHALRRRLRTDSFRTGSYESRCGSRTATPDSFPRHRAGAAPRCPRCGANRPRA